MKPFILIIKKKIKKHLLLLIYGTFNAEEEIFYQGETHFNIKIKILKIRIMKLASNNFLEALSASEFENLTIQVKETLATNTGIIVRKKPQSIFTAAELWNIHRQRKTGFARQNLKSGRF